MDGASAGGMLPPEVLAAARTAAQRKASEATGAGQQQQQDGAHSAEDRQAGHGEADEEDNQQQRKRRKKSRWGNPREEQQKALEAVDESLQQTVSKQVQLPNADQIKAHLAGQGVSSELDSEDPEVHRMHAKLMDINQRINAGDFTDTRPEHERSPSPEPVYDSEGVRQNTRDVRNKERLYNQRNELIEQLMKRCPSFKPPADWRPPKKERKVFIPQEDYPGFNFIGLIIGPRGNTQKRLQRETNTKIAIRGKGSLKEGQARDPNHDHGEDEDLHVLVSGDSEDDVEKGVQEVQKLLEPSEEQMVQHKREQLRELAMINGTLKDNENCYLCGNPGHMQFDCPERNKSDAAGAGPKDPVTCRICGEGGHIAVDCPLKNTEEAQKLTDEYKSFLQEIGVENDPGFKGAPDTEALAKQSLQRSRDTGSRNSSSSQQHHSLQQQQQHHQQRHTGPGRHHQEIDEAKLYVGNLPSTMTEDKLRDMFARCGEIVEVKAMPHKHYAFVRFTHKDYAAAGIDMWSGQYVDGNQLTVKIAGVPGGSNKQQKQDEDPLAKLYVSYLPQHYDCEKLKQLFSSYGNVVDSKIIYERDGGPSKGYGFVRFDSQDSAAQAIYGLNGCPLEGKNLVVRIANKGQHQQQYVHNRGIPQPPPPPPPPVPGAPMPPQQQRQQQQPVMQPAQPQMYGYMDPQQVGHYAYYDPNAYWYMMKQYGYYDMNSYAWNQFGAAPQPPAEQVPPFPSNDAEEPPPPPPEDEDEEPPPPPPEDEHVKEEPKQEDEAKAELQMHQTNERKQDEQQPKEEDLESEYQQFLQQMK